MNNDYRLSVTFTDHPKTIKLTRLLGADAVVCLLRLFGWTAQYKPDGIFKNTSIEDLEIAAKWEGAPNVFIECLIDVGFMDIKRGVYSLHDWKEHNPFAYHAKSRSNKAKRAAKARWSNKAKSDAKQCAEHDLALLDRQRSNAPSPIPNPSPNPNPNPNPDPNPSPPPDRISPDGATVLGIPLRDKTHFAISQPMIDEWADTFPLVDIMAELKRCRQWNNDNQGKRKTRDTIAHHISTWLSKAQDRGGHYATQQQAVNPKPSLAERATQARERFEQQYAADDSSVGADDAFVQPQVDR